MNGKILIVDDDRFYSVYLCRLLEKSFPEYELITAMNGEEAWHILNQENWNNASDILILDLEMPKLNGYGLLKLMGKTTKEFPRVVVNSNYKLRKQDLEGVPPFASTIKPLNYSKVEHALRS